MSNHETINASTDDGPPPVTDEERQRIRDVWVEGEKAPYDLFLTEAGNIAESVVDTDPHEVLARKGESISADTVRLVNRHLNASEFNRLS